MTCECTHAGWCERHKVRKANRMVELCQQGGEYWDAWESNRGPGQVNESGKKAISVKRLPSKSAWHVIHTRYANAIKSGKWNKDAEWAWYNFSFVRMIPCGSCGNRWAELSSLVDLSTAESAFDSIWKAHNVVSAEHVKPQNRTISYEQCRAIYLGEKVDKNCVVTLATGPSISIHNISKRSIASYADRCKADYIELKGVTENWWGLEKFRVYNLAKAYNRLIFLDADLIVKNSCPNLFECIPEDSIGMHDDFPLLQKTDWLNVERRSVFASQEVDGDYRPTTFNTGVVVCSRLHADIWTRPKDPFPTSHCAEQIWIEYLAKRHRMQTLPTEYNTQWWMTGFEKLKANAHIVHWANCKSKVAEMSRFEKAQLWE